MVAVTYDTARAATGIAPERAANAAPRKSWFARFVDALMESRMQQAEREIRKYAHLMPHAGSGKKSGSGDMPFGGW